MLFEGDSVMIYSGKYTSYYAAFISYSECKRYVKVRLDLSPERRFVTLRLLTKNISDKITQF